jgi:hypothetical protein
VKGTEIATLILSGAMLSSSLTIFAYKFFTR